ncbi:MAG: ChaN family lipoprotein [Acidobacteria bacterium]|nr:ChaN family lipoprotein [Acidobacteriota bacterium]
MKEYGVRRLLSILLFTALAAQLAAGAQETPAPFYRAFDAKGNAVTLRTIVDSLERADVLFVGETHDNPVAHLLEAELLRRTEETFGATSQKHRAVALSLEMFERDVQTVVDEYLAGLITERHFLLSSRPWNNYQMDYRPLVEYAREQHLPVIAANAPARYVSRVSSQGPDSLKALPQVAVKSWLPPLPFPAASEGYAAKFNRFMAGDGAGAQMPASQHGGLHLLEAQTLRDASMAYAVSEYLKRVHDPLVVEVNGTFHSEERMGVPEQLAHYRPKARAVVVTILPADTFPNFDADLGRLGDFVIITDPAAGGSRQ